MESLGAENNLNVYLFNCDRTYKLDAVEMLLRAVEETSNYKFAVTKQYFSLPKMAEISEQVAKYQMDFVFFVVHANESRLSINEERAGIGYSKIYRSLMKATGGRVLIVIGGDENYKGEENSQVLSRWAKAKILSQFSAEYLDGRKSFIFSWYKQHRYIHTEAMLHFLDGTKADQIFTPVPRSPPVEDKPAHDTPLETQPKEAVSLPEDPRPIKLEASLEEGSDTPTPPSSYFEPSEPPKQIQQQKKISNDEPSCLRKVFILSYKVDECRDPVPIVVDFFTLVAEKLRFKTEFFSSPNPERLQSREKGMQDYVVVFVERSTFEKEKKRVNSLLEEAHRKAGICSIVVICRDDEWNPGQYVSASVEQSFVAGGGIVLSWNENHQKFSTSSHQDYLEGRLSEQREGMETRVMVQFGWFSWLRCNVL